MNFYTQNGWAGSNYDSKLSTKGIAAKVRAFAKKNFPEFKFSVRTEWSMYTDSMYIELKEGTCVPFVEGSRSAQRGYMSTMSTVKGWENELTPEMFKVLDAVTTYANSFRYDDSDGMQDYYDTNFYLKIKVIYEYKVVEPKVKKSSAKDEKAEGSEKIEPVTVERLEIVDYSEKAIAMFGDTKTVKDQLKELGGCFNPSLKYNGEKRAGWIFSKKQAEAVRELANTIPSADDDTETAHDKERKRGAKKALINSKLKGFKGLRYYELKNGRKIIAKIYFPNDFHPFSYMLEYTFGVCAEYKDLEELFEKLNKYLDGCYLGNYKLIGDLTKNEQKDTNISKSISTSEGVKIVEYPDNSSVLLGDTKSEKIKELITPTELPALLGIETSKDNIIEWKEIPGCGYEGIELEYIREGKEYGCIGRCENGMYWGAFGGVQGSTGGLVPDRKVFDNEADLLNWMKDNGFIYNNNTPLIIADYAKYDSFNYPTIPEELDGFKLGEVVYDQCGEIGVILSFNEKNGTARLNSNGCSDVDRLKKCPKEIAEKEVKRMDIIRLGKDLTACTVEAYPLENIHLTETDNFNGVRYYDIEGAGIITSAKVRADIQPGDVFNVYTDGERKFCVTYDGVSVGSSLKKDLPGIIEFNDKVESGTLSTSSYYTPMAEGVEFYEKKVKGERYTVKDKPLTLGYYGILDNLDNCIIDCYPTKGEAEKEAEVLNGFTDGNGRLKSVI